MPCVCRDVAVLKRCLCTHSEPNLVGKQQSLTPTSSCRVHGQCAQFPYGTRELSVVQAVTGRWNPWD